MKSVVLPYRRCKKTQPGKLGSFWCISSWWPENTVMPIL